MGALIDLTGKRFGKLVVLGKADKMGRKIRWKCKCDCGNETIVIGDNLKNGHTSSCGCLRHATPRTKRDLTGQQFHEWTVLRESENKPGYWYCRCSCGVERDVYGASLTRDKSESCGHLHRHDLHKPPLVGRRFGLLVVTEQITTDKGQYCICKCDCGNITQVKRSNLLSGNTKSCGCIRSQGEARIQYLLHDNNIEFKTQYTPPDIQNKKYKFDFFVDNEIMIEFDGPQHTGQISGYYTKDKVQDVIQRDMEKNEYCLSHNIPLYRIPYEYKESIELEDLTNDAFLVTEVDHYHLAHLLTEN